MRCSTSVKNTIALILGVAAASSNAAAIAARTERTEWIFLQNKKEIGDHTVYVTRDAVKLVNEKAGFQILARAPSWKVYCFRPQEKLVWIGDLHDFSGVVLVNPYAAAKKKDKVLTARETSKDNGLNRTRYGRDDRDFALWTADDVELAPQGVELLCRYYSLEPVPKFPFYEYLNKSGSKPISDTRLPWMDAHFLRDLSNGKQILLLTRSWKKKKLNPADFEYPTTYKKVDDIKEVSYSPAIKKQMTNLLDDLGFTETTTPASRAKK